MREILQALIDGEDLTAGRAEVAMTTIMEGNATAAQIAAFLVALRIKGETVDEIVGFAQAMRAAANPLDLGRPDAVDTCGTGGDGAGTFNVSTTAALIAAGAGVPIAKHGNRAVSSASGSADVLEALGVRLVDSAVDLRKSLNAAGIAFLFAPAQHPAMRHAIGPRRELGVRTVFNLLGPLTNPAGARRQVVGVYDPRLVEPLARVLGRLGAVHAVVVHGAGGLDEISTFGPTTASEWRDGVLRTFEIEPGELGFELAARDAVTGGSPAENAQHVREVLGGAVGPRRDLAVINAGAAIYVGGAADDLRSGIAAATSSIDSGAARAALEALVDATAGDAS
ncbi:MAG: anthranilate phosphoribosyltransferase [Acidobacteria bacterium]|nr:anthranilate phosphoribosyltransferase [Acidobacteriota bacterium]